MAKVLLINPQFNIVKENYDSSVSVGLLSIASFLDSQGVNIKLIDCVRQKNYLDIIQKEIVDCEYAGLSVMTMQLPKAMEIAKQIRQFNPRCKIVWGGSHPTFFIHQTTEHDLVDAVCFGEGEMTMLELAQGRPWQDVKGVAYKMENGR